MNSPPIDDNSYDRRRVTMALMVVLGIILHRHEALLPFFFSLALLTGILIKMTGNLLFQKIELPIGCVARPIKGF
jgi:hypothetical protein